MLSGCSVILNVIDLRNRKAACKGNDEQTFTFADAYGKIKKHRKSLQNAKAAAAGLATS